MRHDRGGRFPLYWAIWGRGSQIPRFDGTEGELYNVRDDPHPAARERQY